MMVAPGAETGSIIMVGHYDDTFRRVDGRWLFSKRVVVPEG
jgi:hypothetical protein